MSRPLRIQYPDAWYHVMNRGRRHEVIFPGREDYERFVELLQACSTMFNFGIAAFCLMPNHYHLLVQTPDANLSSLMRHGELALSMLSPTGEDSAKAYRTFVAQEESDELTAALSERNVPSLLGSKEFVGRVKAGFQSLRSHRGIPASRSGAPGLEEIQSAVCASFGLDRKGLLSSRRGMSNDARNVAIYLARRLSCQAAVWPDAGSHRGCFWTGELQQREQRGMSHGAKNRKG
ncbi:MAG: transposase [Thermodesulfobacteriota bacterium]